MVISLNSYDSSVKTIGNIIWLHNISTWFKDAGNSEVRLVGGTSNEGRLEIMYSGKFRTVCTYYFSTSQAKVMCRLLGLDDT